MNQGILHGAGVLVTRPAAQSGDLTNAIEAAGGFAFSFPVLTIEPRDKDRIRRDLAALPTPDTVIYASRNAVQYGAELLSGHSSDNTRIAAIGPATEAALTDAGYTTHICPAEGFDSEHLLRHADLQDVGGTNIIIVRANRGRTLLADTLRDRGARVDYLAVYERQPNAPDDRMLAKLQSAWNSGRIDAVVAMSVDSLDSLMNILPDDCRAVLGETLLVTPSKRVIQKALETLPDMRAMLADGIQTGDLINAIVQGRHVPGENTT